MTPNRVVGTVTRATGISNSANETGAETAGFSSVIAMRLIAFVSGIRH